MSDADLKKYTISDSEAYRLLNETYLNFYDDVTQLFQNSGTTFSNFPIGIQMGVMDTLFRVGKNGFRKGFPNAQKEIIAFGKKCSTKDYLNTSEAYKQSYFKILQELSLGLTDSKTNSYDNDSSARRAARAKIVGLAELEILRGSNYD